MPEITIVITAYNLQAYLDQCLQEFMAQTFQDFDVLIVDDCSTDGKRQIGRRIESGRRVCQNMRGTHRDSQ